MEKYQKEIKNISYKKNNLIKIGIIGCIVALIGIGTGTGIGIFLWHLSNKKNPWKNINDNALVYKTPLNKAINFDHKSIEYYINIYLNKNNIWYYKWISSWDKVSFSINGNVTKNTSGEWVAVLKPNKADYPEVILLLKWKDFYHIHPDDINLQIQKDYSQTGQDRKHISPYDVKECIITYLKKHTWQPMHDPSHTNVHFMLIDNPIGKPGSWYVVLIPTTLTAAVPIHLDWEINQYSNFHDIESAIAKGYWIKK